MKEKIPTRVSRRRFIEYLAGSPLYLPLATGAFGAGPGAARASETAKTLIASPQEAVNIFDLMPVAEERISAAHWAYLMTGSDDNLTVQANRDGFQLLQIRSRRFINIEKIDTSVEVFGQRYPSPVMLAPIGSQQAFHNEGSWLQREPHARVRRK